jgi:hypothetical protein
MAMAQHNTRRSAGKQTESIAPEQLLAAQAWLEQEISAGHIEQLVHHLTEQGPPQPVRVVIEALSRMGRPEAVALLGQIAAKTAGKDLQKAIRRALYRLKTRGVETANVPQPGLRKSVFEVPKLPVVAALASQIDFDGNRALYIARRRPFSGLILVTLIVSDRRGIINCHALPTTKKELSHILAEIRADERFTHIDLPPTYAQQLVEESYQRNLTTGTPLPPEFQSVHDLIGTPEIRWEQAPIYQLINVEDIRGQPALVTLSARLLDLKEFQGWSLPSNVVQPYRDEVRRAAESPLIVSPALQQERVEEMLKRAMREIFDVEEVSRYRRRLEEMAYVLWQTQRPDDASRAVAGALALQGEQVDPAGHPFLRALFRRSVEMAETSEQEDQSPVTVATPRLWTP